MHQTAPREVSLESALVHLCELYGYVLIAERQPGGPAFALVSVPDFELACREDSETLH